MWHGSSSYDSSNASLWSNVSTSGTLIRKTGKVGTKEAETFIAEESAKRIWDHDALHKGKGLVVFPANVTSLGK